MQENGHSSLVDLWLNYIKFYKKNSNYKIIIINNKREKKIIIFTRKLIKLISGMVCKEVTPHDLTIHTSSRGTTSSLIHYIAFGFDTICNIISPPLADIVHFYS